MIRDLFIVIPGIMGSVLLKDGDELWNPGFGMVRQLAHHREWVENLAITSIDDPTDASYLDGVAPSRLVDSHMIVPGFFGIDGYSQLDSALRGAFGGDLVEGKPSDPTERLDGKDSARRGVPNYYRFAYDWRRDIRASSLQLHDLIDVALTNLRDQRSPDAKVIILAHSMGGLLARYYLYGHNLRDDLPFEGWRNVRELLSFGTPYRGSLDAFSRLGTGLRVMFMDLTETLASYTSIYQLLPRYPVVLDRRKNAKTGEWIYPHQIVGLDDFDSNRARLAFEDFHMAIERGVENAPPGGQGSARTVPHIGFGHPTANRVVITDNGLEVGHEPPDYLDSSFNGGDGTVPAISAIPLELELDHAAMRFTNQKHGSLQTDRRVLSQEIHRRLRQSQAGTTPARLGGDESTGPSEPSISLDLPLFTLASEPAQALVKLSNLDIEPEAVEIDLIDLASGATMSQNKVEIGEPLALPEGEGEYRVDARLAVAGLESRSYFAVVGE